MNGVRLLLGFKTVMNDVPHGEEFGRYIRDGYSLTQAWFKAADKLQSQNRVARVLAEETAHFNDTAAHHALVTVVDSDFYWLTHTVGSEPARRVDVAAYQRRDAGVEGSAAESGSGSEPGQQPGRCLWG